MRRLGADLVLHARVPVQPLGWRNLRRPAERDQQAVGDIALREANLARFVAIHVHADFGIVHHLMNMHVHRPRNAGDFPLQFERKRVAGVGIPAGDLDIDRRRKPEIQNLIRDIRRLEIETDAGKRRVQTLAQTVLIFRGRGGSLLFQRKENFAISRAQRRIVAECQIETAVREADVVDDRAQFTRRNLAANLVFDLREHHLRLLRAACPPAFAHAAATVPNPRSGKNRCR